MRRPLATPPRLLFERQYAFGAGITIANYDVTPDGQRFIMVKDEAAGRAGERGVELGRGVEDVRSRVDAMTLAGRAPASLLGDLQFDRDAVVVLEPHHVRLVG